MKSCKDILAEARSVVPLPDSRLDQTAQIIDADPQLRSLLETCVAEDSENPVRFSFLEEKLGELCMGFYAFCILQKIPSMISFYEEHRISQQIMQQTLLDIPRNMGEYEKLTGRFGIGGERYQWLFGHLEGRLFQLGRLQFEEKILETDTDFGTIHLCAGTKVLNTHIPAGEPMPLEACHASYREALAFYEKTFSFRAKGFVCESWLLSPELKNFLGNASNIIQFAREFQCENHFEEDSSFLQYVFSTECQDIHKLPQNSSLQIQLKQFLLSGGIFHSGYGFRPADY